MDLDEARLVSEMVSPGMTPVSGQLAAQRALAAAQAASAPPLSLPSAGQSPNQLTPMGSKSPQQRAREAAALAAILRARGDVPRGP